MLLCLDKDDRLMVANHIGFGGNVEESKSRRVKESQVFRNKLLDERSEIMCLFTLSLFDSLTLFPPSECCFTSNAV